MQNKKVRTSNRWLYADQQFTILPEVNGEWDVNGIRIMATVGADGAPTVMVDDSFKATTSEGHKTPKVIFGKAAADQIDALIASGVNVPDEKAKKEKKAEEKKPVAAAEPNQPVPPEVATPGKPVPPEKPAVGGRPTS